MIETLFNVLNAGLSLWLSKEKTKYVDKLISLRKDFYEEYKKPADRRSDAVLDDIEFQLRILSIAFSSTVGAENPKV